MKKPLHLAGLLAALSFSVNSYSALLEPILAAKGGTLSGDKVAIEHSVRYRFVSYDPAFLFLAAKGQDEQTHVASQIQLNLFDTDIIAAKLERHYTREDGKTVWQGKVVGEPLSAVNLIANQGQLTGNIRTQGKVYQLRSQPSGHILVSEFAKPSTPETDVLEQSEVQLQAKVSSLASQQNTELPLFSDTTQGFTDTADVNVLVYYTRQALEEMPDLLDVIDLEFIDTNQAFENSDVDASVDIAAKIEVDEQTIEYGEDIYEFVNKSGPFANIASIREKYKADLVHLYVQNLKGACGRAWYAAFPDGGTDKDHAYGTTAAYCTGALTTAHELGHNFGAAHDRYVENGGSADTSNYGYVDLHNEFTTVMAYQDKCNANGKYCQTITYFSNPAINFNEHPTGIAEPLAESTDNAAQLNFAGLSLANFYGVTAPFITSITQGELADSITLSWTAITNATGYRVKRREADTDGINGPLCGYPVYGDEFVVNDSSFVDTAITRDTTYCYSVTALNEQLLDNVSSPESFVRTAYASANSELALPLIENIKIDGAQPSFTQNINLPANFDYQLALVEYSGTLAPSVALVPGSGQQYTIELSNIPAQNQTITVALSATHQLSKQTVVQMFSLFISGYENQRPSLDITATANLAQQSSQELAFSIADDQDINFAAVYAYSKNEKLVKQPVVSQNSEGALVVTISHEGLATGLADVVIGYTDGEYAVEKTLKVKITRSIFNPTQTQDDVVWYVRPGESLTRLLPFYDIDDGEALTVTMVEHPKHGTLDWPLSDKVTYTANSDFESDSFSFYVTGEDGVATNTVTVFVDLFQPIKLLPKQNIIVRFDVGYFLNHLGDIYVWGNSSNAISGVPTLAGQDPMLYEAVKWPTGGWINIANSDSQIYLIQYDGTLWTLGYDFEAQQFITELTQVGEDNDWVSVEGRGGVFVLTKTDGSVWGKGHIFSVSNRQELDERKVEPQQIVPLYNIQTVSYAGFDATFALSKEDEIYSWGVGIGSLEDLGRKKGLGYLGRIEFEGLIDSFNTVPYRSLLVSENQIVAWGLGPHIFLSQGSELPLPTFIGEKEWHDISIFSDHVVGIKLDGSLWTWGGTSSFGGVPWPNAYLARGENPDQSINQVGHANHWLKAWALDMATFALDETGQLWVAGGEPETTYYPLAAGDNIRVAFELTKVLGIPADVTGVGDFDQDGIRDYLDNDDDNDGVLDQYDDLMLDPNASLDTDHDGISNAIDTDDDNDGVLDQADAFPLDVTESIDNDSDGIGNNADTDDDNDGVLDQTDAFPFDATESVDTDLDGIGNNADTDDDNDGVLDQADAFPLDAGESVDSDSDGIGNNADTDDDNDGVLDSADAFPLDASESVDSDLDGIGNNADTDDDNDGVSDALDAYPLDATKSTKPVVTTPSKPDSASSGGGSFGYWLLTLLFMRLFIDGKVSVAKWRYNSAWLKG